MVKKYSKILILLIIVTSSCKKRSNFTSVTIASEGCHGTCPIMALEIDENLDVKYYGGEFAKNKGNYRGKISEKYWNSIVNKFESSNYLTLKNNFENNNDFESIEIIIKESTSTKHIKGFYNDMPDDFRAVIVQLLRLPNSLKLIKTTDSLTFITTFQKAESRYGNGVDDLKFLPKIKNNNIE